MTPDGRRRGPAAPRPPAYRRGDLAGHRAAPGCWRRWASRPRAGALRASPGHCPVLHVPEDATDVTAALTNARLRSEIRRHWRRAEAQGITARVVTTDSTEYSLRQALDHLTHLHVLRRDSLGKSSTWSPSVQAFHARACEAAQQYPGCLSFAELLHEGRVIASSYGVRSPVRFCGVQAGWDPVYANCAPMTLLIQQTIAWLATERTPYLCFGSGSATHSYKDRWTETNTHDVALFAVCSPAGRAVTRLARLRHLVRQNGPAQGALLWLTGPDGDPEAVADARHAPAGSTPTDEEASPDVSVVIPTHNRARFCPNPESVQTQSFPVGSASSSTITPRTGHPPSPRASPSKMVASGCSPCPRASATPTPRATWAPLPPAPTTSSFSILMTC